LQRALALSAFDASLIDSLPSLAPLVPLSPAIQLVEKTGEGSAASLRGRFHVARDCYMQVLERLASPETSGLQPAEQLRAWCGAHYIIGLIDAGRGIASAEANAEVLEKERSYQVVAWRVRMLLHLTRGDSEEAARCRRRAELALLREGGSTHYGGTTALGELICHVLCGDLLGVKQTNETLAYLAERFEGWRPFLVYGQCSSLRLQGDAAKALELLLPTLEHVKAGEHASFSYLAASHLQLLTDMGDVARAVELGRVYVADCEREQLSATGQVVHVAAAIALAKSGAYDEAVQMLEGVIRIARERGHGGVCIGSMYEARARVAGLMQDREAFALYAELCGQAYQQGKNTNLAAKLAHLLEEARLGELTSVSSSMPLRAALSEPSPNSEYATLHSRMLECADEGDRARCALTILLQSLESFAGYLYGVNENDHVLLASLPEDETDSALGEWFADLLADELDGSPDVTRKTRSSLEPPPDTTRRGRPGRDHSQIAFRYTDARGRIFEPLFLVRREASEQRLAAVLIFHAGRDTRRRPGLELQEELADQLLTHGDVTGAQLPSIATQTRTQ
jgi:tetratricopeptide (TPR) repeat protein